MGRKIPGRKHRTVKDPEKQKRERFKSLENKINAPPSNTDEQYVPKSLQRVIDLKNKVKTGIIPLKRKRKHKRKGPVTSHPHPIKMSKDNRRKPEKPTPVFTQMKGEPDREFMQRVNRICHSVIKEAHFENKYGVDIKRSEETGEIEEVVKRPKDELEEIAKKARKETKNSKQKKKKKKKKDQSEEPRLTKSQKRRKKLEEKKEKKSENNVDEFKKYEDNVKFGEVVHAPPSLSKPRRVESSNCAPRPGQKDLLLKTVMAGESVENKIKSQKEAKNNSIHKVVNKTIDKKGKRKDLPNALRRQLDKQQKEVIEAYKMLKAKKHKEINH